jgi:hypothetical protein
MQFKYSLIILIVLSLITGFLLLRLAALLTPPGRGRAYAVLVLDEALPDRQIRELLNNEQVISESSQRVLLDDFSGLASIPLDEYPRRVSAFDPRNDGYADRLRSFFIRGGKRFLYVPLGPGAGAVGRLEKQLALSLGDIPFQLEYAGGGKPVRLYFFLSLIAGAAVLWRTRRLVFAPCIPALAGLAFAGAPGMAPAAFLMGLGGLFLAPCGEYFMALRYKKNRLPFGSYESRSPGEIFSPFRKRLFLTPLFIGGLTVCFTAGGVHPLLILGTVTCFIGLYLFSHWTFSRRGESQDHVRFSPVHILKVPALGLDFSRFMLPYALAALFAVPLSLFFSSPAPPESSSFLQDTPPPIREGEYQSHAAFQSSFSLRPLGRGHQNLDTGESPAPVYSHYTLGDDGLIAGVEAVFPGEPDAAGMAGVPLFPLGDLMAALEPGKNSGPPGKGPAWGELIPVFIAFLLSLPVFVKPRRGDKKKKNRVLLHRGFFKMPDLEKAAVNVQGKVG